MAARYIRIQEAGPKVYKRSCLGVLTGIPGLARANSEAGTNFKARANSEAGTNFKARTYSEAIQNAIILQYLTAFKRIKRTQNTGHSERLG